MPLSVQPSLPGFDPAESVPATEADAPHTSDLGTGLMALHSHRAERLLEVVVEWIRSHPLGPLEEEVFIVQSNAVAEWLRMALAQRLGVCAATRVELPARFFWRVSRLTLGRQLVPGQSALDKLPLTWRLMQQLPGLLVQANPVDGLDQPDVWAPLRAFLAPDPAQRLWPLCERLADLYDQYQIYRPDWLADWARGERHVTRGDRQPMPLPDDQLWQAALWQAVFGALSPEDQQTTRPVLMQRVQARLEGSGSDQLPLPRRVVAFGMSHLPPGLLALLSAVSAHSQVLLAVPNPCQYHWADVIDGRELLHRLQRRQRLKATTAAGLVADPFSPGVDLSAVPLEAMHAHAHPLLAAWGRQSRDFVRLLDAVDDTARGQGRPGWPRLDLFVDDQDPEDAHPSSLLRQIQNGIRDLMPLHEQTALPSHGHRAADRSVVFHTAHTPVRELEVLHDQLLALLGRGEPPLQPRDVVVMVPDIAPLAPAIRAVFGQFDRRDPRYIPFDLADLGAEAISPLVTAWRWLWRLPDARVGLSEWLSLLEVPAIQTRFGFGADDVPRLAQWLVGAGLRWGLNPAHRAALGLPGLADTHTAQAAVQRMLWGYAVGDVEAAAAPADEAPDQPEPFADVAGLDAALAGCMAHLCGVLQSWWSLCRQPAEPAGWVARGHWLIRAVFHGGFETGGEPDDAAGLGDLAHPETPPGVRWPALAQADQAAIDALAQAGQQWLAASADAGLQQPIALGVARSAWEAALRLPEAEAGFHAGGVTFCTLLPMRAIPFRVVCLLGMNDGDYPRRAPRPDLDLMARPGMARPGDRSRRDDDRQLMLEALLSARDVLYLSWCGHSVRDNAEQPPSVLVAQLRDHIAQGWGQTVLDTLTTHHPLQPFSPLYLTGDEKWFTHAHEWHRVHHQIQEQEAIKGKAFDVNWMHESSAVPSPVPDDAELPSWTLHDLAQALRHPVRVFARRQLAIVFDAEESDTPDDEPFDLDGLQRHRLQSEWLEPLIDSAEPDWTPADMAQHVQSRLDRAQRAGHLPLGTPGAVWQAKWVPQWVRAWVAWQGVRAALPRAAERLPLLGPPPLADWLDALWQPANEPGPASDAWADLQARFPALVGAQQVCRVRDPSRMRAKDEPTKSVPQAQPIKPKQMRVEKLVPLWLRALALASVAPSPSYAHVLWVAADVTLHAQPLSQEEAQAQLVVLADHLDRVLREPLPLPSRTALSWLLDGAESGLPWGKLRTAYEGDPHTRGEAAGDPYWSRFFPDLDSLLADGRFETLAPALWQPFLRWLEAQVTVAPHPESP